MWITTINQYDIIISGIEVDEPGKCIISREQLSQCKKNCLLIDAAADAGNAIEGTRYTSIDIQYIKKMICIFTRLTTCLLFSTKTPALISVVLFASMFIAEM
ncbi:hypothetical protein [Ihubacter massiliensis]|uniref:hypothetical protein n=1 Tax=Ihubacter massiliensis TaxID=1852367 RepID=UPI00345C2713